MTGAILVDQDQPFYVDHEGSTAVVYGIAENDDTRQAAIRLIDLLAPTASVIVIDHRTATVRAFPKARLTPSA